MTYPQQPQYQYGQPPAGYAPQGAFGIPQPPPPAGFTPPQFVEPPRMGEGGAPLKIRELEGRACGIRPTGFTPANPAIKDDRDKIIFDVLVLDGPTPLEYGASQGFQDNPAGPPCYALDSLPAEIKGVVNGNWEIVKACKAILDVAPGNVIPCRVVRGTQGNRPYMLAALGGPLDTAPQVADQMRGMLGAAYVAIGTGVWPDGRPYVAPVPREINGGPRQKPTQGAPTAPVAQYPPVQYPPAAPAGQVVYPGTPGPSHPVVAAYNAANPQAPIGKPTREQYLSGEFAPEGWDIDTWRTRVPPADRAKFLPA